MNLLLLLAFALANCLTLSWCQTVPPLAFDSPLADSAKKCIVQENVETQYVADFVGGKIKIEDTTRPFKCFIRCVVESAGYMKDGELMVENIVKAAEKITNVDKVRRAIDGCKNLKVSDVCETSFNYYVCIFGELKSQN